jgi:AcrR family transcriptional regulator
VQHLPGGDAGPGLYRYYASRDDLLAALVTLGYARLAAALQDAEHAAEDLPADGRLSRVAHAYRDWAVANPRYYQFLFGIRPDGMRADSDEAVDVMHGGMRVLEDVVAALTAQVPAPHAAPPGDALDRQLPGWSHDRDDQRATPVLRLAVLAWTRLHGIVGLELTGALARMGLDPGLLLDDELRRLVAERTPARPRRSTR